MNEVIKFAEKVLAEGRDCYRTNPTPLFADGINTITKEQVQWNMPGEGKAVLSNLACQQNLFRTFTLLSSLTGKPKYKEAVKEAIAFHFNQLADESGLLQWGGHRFIDLMRLKPVGPGNKSMVHELKNCFPYYELMYEVDQLATEKYIRAFWNAHIYDWKELYVGRHGKYGLPMGRLWEHETVNLTPMRESTGLSFINAGNDLIYSAGMLYKLNGEHSAFKWSKHLAGQYVAARHPDTGLGAYQFTQPLKVEEPRADADTLSKFGDRAKRQFGPEFGAIALEGNLLLSLQAMAVYCENALMQMQLAKELGIEAREMLGWVHSGLTAFAKYAYIPEKNKFKPMFTDGTDLSGYILPRDGYYGRKGTVLEPYHAGNEFLLSYARCFLMTGDGVLWSIAKNIAHGNGLGDIGSEPGMKVQVNLQTDCSDSKALFAVLDVYKATSCQEYLKLARLIGSNIIKDYYHQGYFMYGPDYLYAKFDRIEPLALLALQAAEEGRSDAVPGFINGSGFTAGAYEFPDGTIKEIQDGDLYTIKG